MATSHGAPMTPALPSRIPVYRQKPLYVYLRGNGPCGGKIMTYAFYDLTGFEGA
jgi:hypothetical protein